MSGSPFRGAPGGGGAWAWGFGIALAGGYRDWPLRLGIDANFTYFGTLRGSDGGETARRRQQVFLGNMFLRVQPATWSARPYVEGLVGFKSVVDNYTVGPIAGEDEYVWEGKRSVVHSLGVGAGIELTLRDGELARTYLTLGIRWLHGGDVAFSKRIARADEVVTSSAKLSTTTTLYMLGLAIEL